MTDLASRSAASSAASSHTGPYPPRSLANHARSPLDRPGRGEQRKATTHNRPIVIAAEESLSVQVTLNAHRHADPGGPHAPRRWRPAHPEPAPTRPRPRGYPRRRDHRQQEPALRKTPQPLLEVGPLVRDATPGQAAALHARTAELAATSSAGSPATTTTAITASSARPPSADPLPAPTHDYPSRAHRRSYRFISGSSPVVGSWRMSRSARELNAGSEGPANWITSRPSPTARLCGSRRPRRPTGPRRCRSATAGCRAWWSSSRSGRCPER
jgi:hypothetical protein